MKKVLSFVLISALCLPALLQLSVIADFYAKRDYIVSTLCVRKDQIKNTCGGSCHLSKQMAKTQEKEGDKELPVSSSKTEVSPGILTDVYAFYSADFTCTFRSDQRKDLYSFICLSDFFHPPVMG